MSDQTGRIRAARVVAILADVTQIVLFPLFAGGAASPWNDALDLAVAGVLSLLIGWHWAFLPSFLTELVPGLDLIPTWTAAVLFVTRKGAPAAPPAVKPPPVIDAEVVSRGKGV